MMFKEQEIDLDLFRGNLLTTKQPDTLSSSARFSSQKYIYLFLQPP